MMWMAGSTVHLFSIGITFSALWQPISALQSVGKSMFFYVIIISSSFSVHLMDSVLVWFKKLSIIDFKLLRYVLKPTWMEVITYHLTGTELHSIKFDSW